MTIKQILFWGVTLLATIVTNGLSMSEAFAVGNEYHLISTGIKALDYHWCDSDHLVVEGYPDVPDAPKPIYYLTVSDKISTTDVMPLDQNGNQIKGVVISCSENEILFLGTPVPGPGMPKQRRGYFTLIPDRAARRIADLKGGVAAVDLKDKYIVATKAQLWVGDHYDVDPECADYIHPDYKLLCWSPAHIIQNTFHPLSKYVLMDYVWANMTDVREAGGLFFNHHVENQEMPITSDAPLHRTSIAHLERGKNGVPNVDKMPQISNILLFDLQGNLLARLNDDPVYKIIMGKEVSSPNEEYLYAPCDRRGESKSTDQSFRVCRFKLDDQQNHWSEVFAPAVTMQGKGLIQEVAVDGSNNIYFDLSLKSISDPNQGIWRYDAKTGAIKQISTLPIAYTGVSSHSIKISADGEKVSFIGLNGGKKIFILQSKNQGDAR